MVHDKQILHDAACLDHEKKILNAQKLAKDRTFLLFLIYGFVWLLQELIVGMMPTY